jgi:hypothetical protein
MSIPRLPRPKTLMFASALLCVVLVPLVYAAVHRNSSHQRYYDEVVRMTESERRQLEHNFKAFQSLSPEKQEQFRELHSQLQGEFRHLEPVLVQYHEFLRSLDPGERSDIERQTNFSGKMRSIQAVVNRLNDETQRHQELLQASYAQNQRRSDSSGGRRWNPTPLSPEEIDSLVRVLESHYSLTPAQKTVLGPLKGADRLAYVLSVILPRSAAAENKPFFTSQLTHELVAALSDERQKYFTRHREGRQEEERRFEERVKAGQADSDQLPFHLRKPIEEQHEMFLLGNCLYTFNRLLEESAPPPEKMAEFLKQLPADVRNEFLTQNPGRLYDKLVEEYYRREPTPLSKSTRAIQEQFDKRIPKGPPRGRSGPGRSSSGRSGSGGERERLEDRPPQRPRERDGNEADPERPRGVGFPDRPRDFRNERPDGRSPRSSESPAFERQ